MIDHISIAVRDLEATGRFYQTVLGTLGYERLRVQADTLGFGKRYPESGRRGRESSAAALKGKRYA